MKTLHTPHVTVTNASGDAVFHDDKRTQGDLQALLEELQQAKDEALALDLETQIEVAERYFADIVGKFKKYQASVDAGYDDKETCPVLADAALEFRHRLCVLFA